MVSSFNRKQKNDKLFILAGGLIILFLFFSFFIANFKIYFKRTELISQIKSLDNKVQEMKDKNKNLEQSISKTNEESYAEKVAREELDLQKPGEKVVSFVVSKDLKKQSESSNKSSWFGWIGKTWQWLKDSFKK